MQSGLSNVLPEMTAAVRNLRPSHHGGVLGLDQESQSKPGVKMVYPEPCKELRRRPQQFLAGTAPY